MKEPPEDGSMPTRTDEGPPPQQDRAPEQNRHPQDEVLRFETDAGEESGNYDSEISSTADEDINTHGSER
jgi:hypothetical protein